MRRMHKITTHSIEITSSRIELLMVSAQLGNEFAVERERQEAKRNIFYIKRKKN